MKDVYWCTYRIFRTPDFTEALCLWDGDVSHEAATCSRYAAISRLKGKPTVLRNDPLIDGESSAIAEVIHAYPRGIVHAVRYRYSERDGMDEWHKPFREADDRFYAARSAAWKAISRQERVTCRNCRSVVVMAHCPTNGDCPVCEEEYGLFPVEAIPDRDVFKTEARAEAGPKPPLVEKIGWVIGGDLPTSATDPAPPNPPI